MFALYEKLKHPRTLYCMFAGLFLIHVLLTWPGTMTPDSQTQYAMAMSGIYNDHHPPMMSIVWGYLNIIYPGPGLVLLLNLTLLYTAVCIFFLTFNDLKIKLFYLLFPLIPSVLIYSWMIWKDVGFAFSYLFLAAVLTHFTILKKPLSFIFSIGIFLVLFYGTAIKFQAQYCAPLMLLWIAYIYNHQKLNLITFASALFLNILFFIALNTFNSALVPEACKSHSWQYVKLYDLAAISYATGRPSFPDANKTSHFSMEKLKKAFSSQRVDDLVFEQDSILQLGKNEQERQQLWTYWSKTVIKHPFIYLKHRLYNAAYILLSVPIGNVPWLETVWRDYVINPPASNPLSSILAPVCRAIGILTLAHLPIIILGFLYVILALKALPYTEAAVPLIFMNLISLNIAIVLFFFSMAGTPRYTYVSICLTHASHALAFLCWKAVMHQRRRAKVT